jgi:hypothetical protein
MYEYLDTYLSRQKVENCIIKFSFAKDLCSAYIKYRQSKLHRIRICEAYYMKFIMRQWTMKNQ